jgi:DNA gyrase subunit B
MSYDKITVLSDRDHVRLRPGMYVGSTENPTHLLTEVIDNSLDEASAGYCSMICVCWNTSTPQFAT